MSKKAAFNLFFLFIIIFLILNIFISAQTRDKTELKLSAVQEGNNQITDAEWNDLKFTKGNPVYISFSLSKDSKQSFIYRVMLDSKIIEPGLMENFLTLKDLEPGVHILKISPYTTSGTELDPLTVTFTVVQPEPPKPVEEKKPVQEEIKPAGTSILVYIFGGTTLLLLVFVIILIIKRPKEVKEDNKEDELKKQFKEMQEEYVELHGFNKRLKDEIKDLMEYNEYLKKQKADLEANIRNLEGVNVNLLEQKEKLLESKRQLELLHTQKDELFAMAIHDIKNPVSAIRGYVELLNSYDLNATEQHEIMTNLVSSSENVVKLTQSMCTIIAQERPEPTLKFATSSIKKLIDDVCNQNMSYAKAKSIKLFNKSSVGLPDIAIDEIKIQEAIENLVNNAIKYGPPDSTVEVRTFVKNNMLTVEVQDTGVGIPEPDLKRVFQKGATLTPKPTGLEQSSGLGLWIVKRIVDEHNGKVWVNSKVGSGSTFGFELPFEVRDRKTTMY